MRAGAVDAAAGWRGGAECAARRVPASPAMTADTKILRDMDVNVIIAAAE
jgi:hypothetical protein